MAVWRGARDRMKTLSAVSRGRYTSKARPASAGNGGIASAGNGGIASAGNGGIASAGNGGVANGAEAGLNISQCHDHARVTLAGVVGSVRAHNSVLAVEAQLVDDSDSLTLIWLGRRSITGITEGRSLTVRGRIGRRAGERVMYNPAYELRV